MRSTALSILHHTEHDGKTQDRIKGPVNSHCFGGKECA